MSTDHGHGHDGLAVARRLRSLEDALVAAGVLGIDDVDAKLDAFLTGARPINGARLIARAWTDPAFKARLLADGNRGVEEMGMSTTGPHVPHRLKVVENTGTNHNMIVCTLCSCYPMALLGPSPGWYRSVEYRARAVREPRAVLAEFGLELGDDVTISVWDSTAEVRYLVLPVAPDGAADLTVTELERLVTRAGMIGTASV